MSTVPMVSPDGTTGDIPHDRVAEAVKSGFKIGAELKAPGGQVGVVPLDRVHEAVSAGFMLQGAPIKAPGAPQLSPSEEMPLSQAQEDAKDNTGKTLKELGAPAAAGLLVGGGAGALAPKLAYGAGFATEALSPIVKKYGIKALEGAGFGAGLGLYRELKKVYEGQ